MLGQWQELIYNLRILMIRLNSQSDLHCVSRFWNQARYPRANGTGGWTR